MNESREVGKLCKLAKGFRLHRLSRQRKRQLSPDMEQLKIEKIKFWISILLLHTMCDSGDAPRRFLGQVSIEDFSGF